MKRNLSLWLAALLAVMLFSCNKDILSEEFAEEQSGFHKQNFSVYQWPEKENNFFSLNPSRSSNSLDMRSEEYPTIYQPLLVEAYNEIARQNEIHGFVSEIAAKAGYPEWSRSYVSKNNNSQENLVIIPLSFDGENKLSGLIIASNHISACGRRWAINGMSREELLSAQTGNPIQKGTLALWVLNYEHRYFQTESETLKDAYCVLKTRGEDETIVNSPVFNPPPDCTWRILEICSDGETQIFWQAGVDMIPLHLDHDRDGILNQNDQDWHEFMQRHNITQEQFTQAIDSWWEDHYQDQYGDYDDFWEEFYLDGDGEDITDFLNNLWNDIEDFFNDLFDGDNPFEHNNDDYYPDLPCPWDDPFRGDEISSRDIRCDYYYVRDCGTGADNWWQFTDWITCPNCTEQDIENENQWFYIRLNAYIDYYRLESYRDLLLSITANVPVLLSEDEVFQLFSTAFLDHFLSKHSGITLSTSERKWLIGRPNVIGVLWDISNITGQGDVYEQSLDIIIQLCESLGLNEGEAIWLIQHTHLFGDETVLGIKDFLLEKDSDNASKIAGKALVDLLANKRFEGPYDGLYESIINHYGSSFTAIDDSEETNSIPVFQYASECAILKLQHPDWPDWRIHLNAIWNLTSGVVHTALDICGLIPAWGEPCDLVNGTLYIIQGDGVNATLSFAASIPLVGWVATGAKYAKILTNTADGVKTLKIPVDATTGVVSFSIPSGTSFRKMVGVTNSNFQAHHIIPQGLRNHPAIQKAAKAGNTPWHLHHPKNGVGVHLDRHNGSHGNYNNQVQAFLDNIDVDNLSPDAISQIIINKQNEWRNFIETATGHINQITLP